MSHISAYNDAWQYYISIKFVFQINSPKDELLFYKLSSSLCIFFKKNGRMMMFVEFQCFCQTWKAFSFNAAQNIKIARVTIRNVSLLFLFFWLCTYIFWDEYGDHFSEIYFRPVVLDLKEKKTNLTTYHFSYEYIKLLLGLTYIFSILLRTVKLNKLAMYECSSHCSTSWSRRMKAIVGQYLLFT